MTNKHKNQGCFAQIGKRSLLALAALSLGACSTQSEKPEPVVSAAEVVKGGLPVPSVELDKVRPAPAPRFTALTVFPAPASFRAEDMPDYNKGVPEGVAETLNLEQVYLLALQNDPQLHGAYQELQAMGFGVKAAQAGLLPTVMAELNRGSIRQNVVNSQNQYYQGGRANWTENGWALTLTQPIIDAGAYYKWRQAQDAERKEVASYAAAQQALMLRTATAYLSILAAQDQIELTEAEHQATLKQMELVRARYQSGQETRVGVSEVQARLDIQRANTLLARNDHEDKKQALLEIIGHGKVKPMALKKTLPKTLPEPNDVEAWVSTALEQNWSIRMAAAAVAVAEKEISVQRSGHYPYLGMRASTGRNETGGSLFGGGSTVDDTRIVLNLSVPIYQGGYTANMQRAAASRLGAASADLSLARRQVQRQVFSAFQSIVTGVDRMQALDSSINSFELALNLKQQGFAAGLNDVVSVLDATRNLYNAKRQQAEASYNFVLEGLKLKQAAGTLSAVDIAAVSQLIH